MRSFTFDTLLANGAAYNVSVLTDPTGQDCSVANGSGTVAAANVTRRISHLRVGDHHRPLWAGDGQLRPAPTGPRPGVGQHVRGGLGHRQRPGDEGTNAGG